VNRNSNTDTTKLMRAGPYAVNYWCSYYWDRQALSLCFTQKYIHLNLLYGTTSFHSDTTICFIFAISFYL